MLSRELVVTDYRQARMAEAQQYRLAQQHRNPQRHAIRHNLVRWWAALRHKPADETRQTRQLAYIK